jgi:DNA-binding transcriptional regulator GbsR (MarR family)
MEIEPMISGSKWQIIELLSERSHSPTEIAGKTRTSLANISQQLRLLEVTGLVKKEKQQSRAKGKPHMLFSLNSDFLYIVSMFSGFSGKKLMPASEHQKAVAKIWSLAKPEIQQNLEKLFLEIEKDISQIMWVSLSPDSRVTISAKTKEAEKRIMQIDAGLKLDVVGEKACPKSASGQVLLYSRE